MTDLQPPHRMYVATPQGEAGQLRHDEDYYFDYREEAPPDAEICLGMPKRRQQYVDRTLFPIFQMNLPEGYVLEQLRLRLAKATRLDPMLLLAMTGGEAAIGRLRLHCPEIAPKQTESISLSDVLAHQGSEDLFRQLVERYLFRTGISGVQPKLLLPVHEEPTAAGKGTLTTPELIVKTGSPEYPGLPINEYVCMSIAREAGLAVPEFHLSADHQRFVMRRFDQRDDATALGFEDMAVLLGVGADQKYLGSYERVAKLIRLYCPPQHRADSLVRYFDQVALSCMVGNGDAHLKNFGLLYTHPAANDARLSPVYDIVCTTCYLPDDTLALTLSASKSLFRARVDLPDFGKDHCDVDDPAARMAHLLSCMKKVLEDLRELIDEVPNLSRELGHRHAQFEATFG